jgi:hypothetical protein
MHLFCTLATSGPGLNVTWPNSLGQCLQSLVFINFDQGVDFTETRLAIVPRPHRLSRNLVPQLAPLASRFRCFFLQPAAIIAQAQTSELLGSL